MRGASVATVARRHEVNANHVFAWWQVYRQGLLGEKAAGESGRDATGEGDDADRVAHRASSGAASGYSAALSPRMVGELHGSTGKRAALLTH